MEDPPPLVCYEKTFHAASSIHSGSRPEHNTFPVSASAHLAITEWRKYQPIQDKKTSTWMYAPFASLFGSIMAFYALQFPRARLGFMMRLYVVFRWVSLPASAMFTLWILMQLFGVWAQLSGFSNVSALAHLGGAATGLAFWLVHRYFLSTEK